MRFRTITGLILLAVVVFPPLLNGQLSERENSEVVKWETLLREAEIVGHSRPWPEKEAVTRPLLLSMEKDGIKFQAIWKNPKGRMRGFAESWKWEIAAYRIDRCLGLGMVPPTVERSYRGKPGSLQLYIDYWISYQEKAAQKIKTPSRKVFQWNRALYLQRAFDNLIANVDRHQRNYLITEDWRMILIDHSRSFRTSRRYTNKLIYDEKFSEGPFLMKQLPADFYGCIQGLSRESLQTVVGEYLTDKEIKSVLKRRDLIVDWIEKRCEKMGREEVIY